MPKCLAITAVALLLALLGAAPNDTAPLYTVQVEKLYQDPKFQITVQFKIQRADGSDVLTDVADEIRVTEDGQPVTDVQIYRPSASRLTTVLTLDTSGSMVNQNKMAEAKDAARLFLDKLNPRADCGLILFDHELRVQEPPAGERLEPDRLATHRGRLRDHIDQAQPHGGTAYLDAAANAIEMLREAKGRKAVLLMTDGVDLNSERSLDEVIDLAQQCAVPLYTIGVGEPGTNEPVTSILVLDHSGSMRERADDGDRIQKIEALRRAATKYVKLMRPGARTKLIPFSSRVENQYDFSDDKEELQLHIGQLKANGSTHLYDAAYAALQTLRAAHVTGKRHILVLTDGVDEGSRRRVQEVIELARESGIVLTMLGLGRPGEFDARTLQRMADEPRGKYFHVHNQQELVDIFEQLSIEWHDDGIDEPSLRKLAEKTGGKYLRAADVKDLPLYFRELADELQSTYTATFRSLRPSADGTIRGIDVSVWRNGVVVSNVGSGDYKTHGVVVPQIDGRVYLLLLAVLGGLLLVPPGMRRLLQLRAKT
jgi:VWFA-related protein